MSQFSEMAQKHIDITKQTFGMDLSFDEESIKKQDELIKQGWNGVPPVNLEAPVTLFGCYLGEAMIRNLGGSWVEHNDSWVVELNAKDGSKVKANVFSKVEKRFVNGEEDSLSYFYDMIKNTLNGKVPF